MGVQSRYAAYGDAKRSWSSTQRSIYRAHLKYVHFRGVMAAAGDMSITVALLLAALAAILASLSATVALVPRIEHLANVDSVFKA